MLTYRASGILISKYGLLADVHRIMTGAVKKIAAGQRLTNEQIKLVMMSPPVVYRMLKVAAVYPGAAQNLIDQYSGFVSILIAQSMLNTWFTQISSIGALSRSTLADARKEIRKLINNLQFKTDITKQNTLKFQYQIMDALMGQLNQIDLAVKRDASASGIIGSVAFSQVLAGQVSAGR